MPQTTVSTGYTKSPSTQMGLWGRGVVGTRARVRLAPPGSTKPGDRCPWGKGWDLNATLETFFFFGRYKYTWTASIATTAP